jgi:hypothetical protein
MSTVQEIERAVQSLPTDDLAQFRTWFAEFDSHAWDAQIEEDALAGRLDWLADEAERDLREGRCRDI